MLPFSPHMNIDTAPDINILSSYLFWLWISALQSTKTQQNLNKREREQKKSLKNKYINRGDGGGTVLKRHPCPHPLDLASKKKRETKCLTWFPPSPSYARQQFFQLGSRGLQNNASPLRDALLFTAACLTLKLICINLLEPLRRSTGPLARSRRSDFGSPTPRTTVTNGV